MFKVFQLLAFLFFVSQINAQNYVISETNVQAFHHAVISGKTELTEFEDNSDLNVWNEMPFDWSFYGEQVSGFRVSENGYMSFSNDETINHFDNGDLPNPTYPKNSIFAFWDDFSTVPQINLDVYGLAPNRVLIVDWFGCTKNNIDGQIRIEVRIFEKTQDFQIAVRNYDFDNNSLSGTIGVQNADGTMGVFIENLTELDFGNYFHFDYGTEVRHDAALLKTNQYANLPVGTYPIRCTIKNTGNQILNSVEIGHSINGQNPTYTLIENLDLLPTHVKKTTNFGFIDITEPGQIIESCSWIESVNGNPDQRNYNNEICETSVGINNDGPFSNVLIEERAATWCGFCPPSNKNVTDLQELYPDRIFPVTIHLGDEMENELSIETCYGGSFLPGAYINRWLFGPYYEAETVNEQEYEDFSTGWLTVRVPLTIDLVDFTWNPNTRTIETDVKVTYEDFGIGTNTNVLLMVVEDYLSGEGDGWEQTNAYNNIAGHPFEGAGNPLENYVHRNVLREYIGSDAFGVPVATKDIYSPGEFYTKSYSFQLSEDYNEDNISLVAVVIKYNEGQGNDPGVPGVFGNKYVINSNKFHLDNSVSSIDEEFVNLHEVNLFPNPAYSEIFIEHSLQSSKSLNFTLYDLNGLQIKQVQLDDSRVKLNTSDLSSGIYLWTIEDGEKRINGRFVKI